MNFDNDACVKHIVYKLEQNITTIFEEQKEEYRTLKKLAKNFGISIEKNVRINKDLRTLIENENVLRKIELIIREGWEEKVFQHTKSYYKSPEHEKIKHTLTGKKVNFEYERIINIEDNVESMYFRSGMAAINAILNCWNLLARGKNLKACILSSYYETVQLIKMVSSDSIKIFRSFQFEDYYDLYLIEPAQADYYLTISNLDEIFKSINQSLNFKVLVFDLSFMGTSIDYRKYIENLSEKNIIIFEIESMLKLHQLGMEFCNCGRLSFKCFGKAQALKDIIVKYLEKYRTLSATNLDYFSYTLLDNRNFHDINHINKVLKNADIFYEWIKNYDIPHIYFPFGISKKSYHKTPMINLDFGDNEKSYIGFVSTAISVSEKLGTKIISHNSFGFRNINLEYFSSEANDNFILRISPGAFRGVQFHIVVFLLHYIYGGDKYESSHEITHY
ncbi:hypothetical protein [Lactococcus lactis]|uniref:hypothetical protein n=1 Tax=Lactococcus lactis TaxID=1358 RepID=UPI002417534B|nr:hypothetical protein [Lactococcus lactis]MDG4956186.1 hypothetical protein [Lactococcus lactis]